MIHKNIWFLLLFAWIIIGCSEEKEENSITEEIIPSAFESALEESKELLLLVKNNLLIMDSSNVEAFVVSHNLIADNNNFRSEISFESISLKRVFKCNNGIINTVHFDFYYDSLNTELEQDSETLLTYLQNELGEFNSIHSSSSMKTYTWNVSSNIFDFELFKNGFTFTIRKNQTKLPPIIIEKEIVEQLKLVNALIEHIHNDSINFKTSTMSGIQKLFDVNFKGKANAIAFSETYNENILLSSSFLFDGGVLSGVYFDYMYSDTISKDFMAESKIVKSMITELYGTPSDVATVPLSTSYRWNDTPIVLEVYSDGFSVLMEKAGL